MSLCRDLKRSDLSLYVKAEGWGFKKRKKEREGGRGGGRDKEERGYQGREKGKGGEGQRREGCQGAEVSVSLRFSRDRGQLGKLQVLKGSPFFVSGTATWCSHYGRQYGGSSRD